METTPWLLVTVSVTLGFILILVTTATCVALFVKDPIRRTDAYRVLKLLLSAGGGSGLVATVIQLSANWLS
jgi:hypothetical protein